MEFVATKARKGSGRVGREGSRELGTRFVVLAAMALVVAPPAQAESGWKGDEARRAPAGSWRHPGGPPEGSSCEAATERAVNEYVACLLEAQPRPRGRADRRSERCRDRFESRLRRADRKHDGDCPEVDESEVEQLVCSIVGGVEAYVFGERDHLAPAPCQDDGPIVFDLESGTSTLTGPYPGGPGKCGANQEFIDHNYPGFVMAAIPAAFFSTYLKTGNVACDAEKKVATDESGEPLCYRLDITDSDVSVDVIVADVCAGGCSANVASCVSAEPLDSCQQIASCLDCPDASVQFEPKWRCPPAVACFEQENPGQDWEEWTAGFPSATLGINTNSECVVGDNIPSGDFPAFPDWCSGQNAHFDVQTINLLNPTVVGYQRIPCTPQ